MVVVMNERDLPEPSLAKLKALRRKARDAHDLVRGATKRKDDVIDRVGRIRRREEYLQASHNPNGNGRRALAEMADDLAAAEADQRVANDELADLSTRWQDVAGVVARCEEWLADADGPLAAAGKAKPSRRGLGTWRGAVDQIRDALADIDADLHRVRSAPPTHDEAKASVRAQIEALAEAGAPDITSLVDGTSKNLRWPQPELRNDGPRLVRPDGPDAFQALIWATRDQIIAKIESEIDQMEVDPEALTAKDRREAVARLEAKRLEVERTEEVAIEAAEKDGATIPRRLDADPRAILGVEVVR